MAWLMGWDYRKEITVTDESADYQTKVLVGESSGATGEEVDCGGLVAADFDDLRFTSADGITLLDYWIESITGTTPNGLATVWVQNNAGADTTLYMYYGGTETAVSDGAATFIVFDDFERGNNGDTVGGDWTESTPHVHISTDQDIGDVTGFTGTRSAKVIGEDLVNARATIPVTAGSTVAIRYRYYKETLCRMSVYHGDGATLVGLQVVASEDCNVYDGASFVDTTLNGLADSWGLIELNNFDWSAKTMTVVLDGNTKTGVDISWASGSYANVLLLFGIATVDLDWWIDDLIVRKWAATEPSFAFGGEETLTVDVADGDLIRIPVIRRS